MTELFSCEEKPSLKRTEQVWRGKKKYEHTNDFMIELLKLERLLDSESQKQPANKKLSMCLGICRSLLGRKALAWKQKSLKRWQQIRPNKTEKGV